MIYVIENGTGKIVQRIDTFDSHAEHYEREGHAVLVTERIVDGGAHYVSGGEFVAIPEKPSEYSVWGWVTHTWIQDRALAESTVRAKRESLLAAADWTQLPDVPLETKAAWATYRQALRDITNQVGFPFEVTWPCVPI